MRREVITVCGCRIELASGGSGDADPLLILHGAGGAAAYEPMANGFCERFRTLLPQHPGYDSSDDPPWLERIEDLAYFYLELLQHLDLGPVHVLGHSLGGWIAAEMAIRNPAALRSLSLIAPAGIRVPGVSIADNFLWSPEEAIHKLYRDSSHAERMLAGATDAAFLERVLRNRHTTARLVWNPRWFNPVLHKWLGRVRMPTLIVWGDQDQLFPAAHAQYFAQLIPGSQHRILEECGHMPFIEKPAEFSALIDQFYCEAAR